jgi:hypothetical protein
MTKQFMRIIALLVFASPLVIDARAGGVKKSWDCCMPWESTSEGSAPCCEVTCEQFCEQQTGIPIATDARCGGPPAWCSTCYCECLVGGPYYDIGTHEDDPQCATCEFEEGPYFCFD